MPSQAQQRSADPAIGERLAAIERILRTTAIAAFLLLIAWLLRDVLLLGFAAVLLACLLHGVASFLHRRTGIGIDWTLAFVLVALAALFGGLIWWRGTDMISQAQQLTDRLSEQVARLWQMASNDAWGAGISGSVQRSIESVTNGLPGLATGVVTSTLGIGGSLLVVGVTAICLAASPRVYVNGSLRLLPRGWRPRGHEVLRETGQALRHWCLGQFIDMLVVTLLIGTGLFLLGVPLALTLALIAGLFNFVPYIGALVGAVPAILVALAQSSTLAMWVAVLFLVVQTIEGNLIAPIVQKRTGTLPPALTIVSQTVLGTLFGVLGLILATPFMAMLLVAVRMIYVETVLEGAPKGDAPKEDAPHEASPGSEAAPG
ncbi:MAG: AI-2E family transporter [Rhodospirillales bacterium 69-11]|nr:AI-2E family transporter [Rhodospirillales bacterium]OJW22809.1 MAG: AI-2E family transporter [Rhodospirillales bacterium 69-11]